MSDISAAWKELRPQIGNLISHINSENYQINVKLKELQEKEERQVDLQAQIDEAYNKGIQDLYDAIYALMLPSVRECHLKVPSIPIPELRKIFGTSHSDTIIVENTPEEIINKVNQWKAEKEQKEQEFHVGDEVTINDSSVGIITSFGEDVVWITYRLTSKARGFDYRWVKKDNCKKTGRHFDSIPFDYNPEKCE